MKSKEQKLRQIVQNLTYHKFVHEACLHLEKLDGTSSLRSCFGDLPEHRPFYVASINKLFVAALIFKLVEEEKIHLHTPIHHVLPSALTDGLHVYNGTDYSDTITVKQLLSHTSGLRCYLIDRHPDGTTMMNRLQRGENTALTLETAVKRVRAMRPAFEPGKSGKAHYSNTNYHLLAGIAETVTGVPIEKQMQEMFVKLGMRSTFVIAPNEKRDYHPVRFKNTRPPLDAFFGASRYDVASTTPDLIRFLRAYITGELFPADKVMEGQQWNRIFFPFHYGTGLQRFSIPRFLSPFQAVPEMWGHSGSVGSALFFLPRHNILVAGTTNQLATPQRIYRGIIQAVKVFEGP
ncbi:MAG: class A beta-lactamase-related serine hydrolase [Cryomorphaceae bacterium]|nr:MAG: class A beta-lactamase-related serine hydrolase [Cryomorphaceae bacterium]